jgi:hypothetical protein
MRKKTLQVLLAVVTGSVLTSGCINSHRAARPAVVAVPAAAPTTTRVVVTEAPPAVRQETVGSAPSENHVWVAGYWMRSDNKWVWVPGHWETRPRVGVAWVPGKWDKNPDGQGWVWTPGHWE